MLEKFKTSQVIFLENLIHYVNNVEKNFMEIVSKPSMLEVGKQPKNTLGTTNLRNLMQRHKILMYFSSSYTRIQTCFVQMRKKEPPHPIRVAKTIDVIAR